MVNNLTRVFFIMFAVVASACSTAVVRIHSNPSGAEVYGRPVGGGETQLLGVTPFQMKSEEFEKRFGTIGGAAYLELRKEGFKTDQIYITEVSRIDLSINKDLAPKRDLEMQYWLNKQISSMFEVRRLVDAKRFDEALRLIREVKKETPMVSLIHEMEAGVLLLKREYRSALDAYRVAIKFDPENLEALKMVRYLERTYNFPRQLDVSEVKLPQTRKPAANEEEGQE